MVSGSLYVIKNIPLQFLKEVSNASKKKSKQYLPFLSYMASKSVLFFKNEVFNVHVRNMSCIQKSVQNVCIQ